ncbi:hypothetical protein R2601_04228 [Salipiger bermudensis HTCC2601]|uniref:Uncharacterized protein n=1 Tax=Salipiger bermudensis (strain DSM 26914 / JCM 13377 / KCTC 12554 / HTCC2601) TaxID=314265 RepID=Q0FW00_SALBH|nr:hypothetical protein R2601_04228 [Salipiger bermudensis HTCC2601]
MCGSVNGARRRCSTRAGSRTRSGVASASRHWRPRCTVSTRKRPSMRSPSRSATRRGRRNTPRAVARSSGCMRGSACAAASNPPSWPAPASPGRATSSLETAVSTRCSATRPWAMRPSPIFCQRRRTSCRACPTRPIAAAPAPSPTSRRWSMCATVPGRSSASMPRCRPWSTASSAPAT